jgi:hypothetical protein
MEKESVGKSNQKSSGCGPGGRIVGGDLGPPQFRAGGVRAPPAAGCGWRRSPALPRPSHRWVGQVSFGKASESSVGKVGGNSLLRTVIAGGRSRSSSCKYVGHWISVHCRSFCAELQVLNEW